MQGRTIALDIMPAGRTQKGEKMNDFKYGLVAETKTEKRALSATYSGDNVHHIYIARIDRNSADNARGASGVAIRAAKMQSADAFMYADCETIGTAWEIVSIPVSAFFNQKTANYQALFDNVGRLKLTKKAHEILDSMIVTGTAKVIYKGSDYVTDLYTAYMQTKNFGYAVEVFLFGKANHNVLDRNDSMNAKHGIQVKCALTLYRTERKPNTAKNGAFYEVGTNCGTSTANGFR